MKTLGKVISWALMIIGLVATLGIIADRIETIENDFDTFSQLESSGLIEHGWIPTYFPKSATSISQRHNIDSNQIYATFNYNVDKSIDIERICQLQAENNNSKKYICPSNFESTNIFILRLNGTGTFLGNYNGN